MEIGPKTPPQCRKNPHFLFFFFEGFPKYQQDVKNCWLTLVVEKRIQVPYKITVPMKEKPTKNKHFRMIFSRWMFLVDPTGRMKLHPRNDVLPEVQEETQEELVELEGWKGDVKNKMIELNIIDISTDSSDEEDDIASIGMLRSMTMIKDPVEKVNPKSLVPVGGTG